MSVKLYPLRLIKDGEELFCTGEGIGELLRDGHILTVSSHRGVLRLYTASQWEKVCALLSDRKGKVLLRHLCMLGCFLEPENGGLYLPASLLERTGLGTELVLASMGEDTLFLCSPDRLDLLEQLDREGVGPV